MTREHVLCFGADETLTGIETPAARESGFAVLLLNSGIVHHVGIQRLHVTLARRLAKAGIITLRFDFSGIGDSSYRTDGTPFVSAAIEETRQAMDALAARGAKRFLLVGLCSGAVIAFRTALADERPVGVALINPIGHLHGSSCRVPVSHLRRIRRRHFVRLAMGSSFRWKIWRRIVRGGVDMSLVVRSVVATARDRPDRHDDESEHVLPPAVEEYRALVDRGVGVLQLHAEGDEGLDYMVWRCGGRLADLERLPGVETDIVAGANHTFTPLWAQERVVDRILDWAVGQAGGAIAG